MKIEDTKVKIEDRIYTIRGKQVMLDRDLAQLYQVEVSQMNRQVKRNIERFPTDFMFQITKEEHTYLKCHNGISKTRGGDRTLPYAFTEHGISMLAGLLRERWCFLQQPDYKAYPRFAFGRKAEGERCKWLRDTGLWKTAPGVMDGLPGQFCYRCIISGMGECNCELADCHISQNS